MSRATFTGWWFTSSVQVTHGVAWVVYFWEKKFTWGETLWISLKRLRAKMRRVGSIFKHKFIDRKVDYTHFHYRSFFPTIPIRTFFFFVLWITLYGLCMPHPKKSAPGRKCLLLPNDWLTLWSSIYHVCPPNMDM